MDAIETKTLTLGSATYRITVYPDHDASNPLEDWSEIGYRPDSCENIR